MRRMSVDLRHYSAQKSLLVVIIGCYYWLQIQGGKTNTLMGTWE